MNPIALKIFGAVSALGAASGGVALVAIKTDLFNLSKVERNGFVFLVSKNSQTAATDVTSPYTCKIADLNVKEENCNIYKFGPNITNKQVKFSDIKEFPKAGASVANATELATQHSIFKMIASDSFIDALSKNLTKKISVEETSVDAKTGKTISSLDVLFAVKSGDKLVGTTKYAVAKASTFIGGSDNPTSFSVSGKKFRCSLTEIVNPLSVQTVDNCEIYDFFDNETPLTSTSNLDGKDFSKGSSTEITITQHKHYLIKYTDTSSVNKNLSEIAAKTTINAFVFDSTNTNKESTSGSVNKISFTNLKPVVLFGTTADDSDKNAFILK